MTKRKAPSSAGVALIGLGFGRDRLDATQLAADNVLDFSGSNSTVSAERDALRFPPEPKSLLGLSREERGAILDRATSEYADRLANACKDGAVEVLVAGSPICYSSTYRRLIRKLEQRNVPVRVTPGASAAEAVCCALRYDYGSFGITIIDTRRFMQRSVRADTSIALLLMGAYYAVHFSDSNDEGAIALQVALSERFSLGLKALFVTVGAEESNVEAVSGGSFLRRLHNVTEDETIFFPPFVQENA